MGWNGTLMPDRDTFLEENFASMDYAVYRAGQLGLRLVVPLTDEWNYFHGGIQDFLGWRGLSDIQDDQDNCVCNIDQHRQDVFYSHPDVIGDFKLYVRRLLEHVNPLTDIGSAGQVEQICEDYVLSAYKDDPTILAWESGNELYYPTFDWTVELARFIKDDLHAQQLFMDGRIISRTGAYPELSEPARREEYRAVVDIVSDHFYPLSLDKLVETAALASSLYGLPLVIGEFGWSGSSNVDVLTFLETLEQLHSEGLVTGSLFWSMFGHAEIFGNIRLATLATLRLMQGTSLTGMVSLFTGRQGRSPRASITTTPPTERSSRTSLTTCSTCRGGRCPAPTSSRPPPPSSPA